MKINSNDFKDITGFLRNVSKKASKILSQIYKEDKKISALAKKLND